MLLYIRSTTSSELGIALADARGRRVLEVRTAIRVDFELILPLPLQPKTVKFVEEQSLLKNIVCTCMFWLELNNQKAIHLHTVWL